MKNKVAKINFTKKQIVIIGVAIAVIVVLAIILICFVKFGANNGASVDEISITQSDIDFDQRVTSEDGGKFEASYQQGSQEDFVVRFADLQCDERCENVREVKLGDIKLTRGDDYEVREGSVIIVLKAKVMDTVKPGELDLVVSLEKEGEMKYYGIKLMIKTIPKCAENEVIKQGECVKKSEGSVSNDLQTSTKTSSTSSTIANKNQSSNSGSSVGAQNANSEQVEAKKPDFNLNEEYNLVYGVVSYCKHNPDGDWCIEDGRICDSKGIAQYRLIHVNTNTVVLEKSGPTSEELEDIQKRGLSFCDGGGSEYLLDEKWCAKLGISCGRW